MTLSQIVSRFQGLRIAVIGDGMVDVYHWGRVAKLSQEAPVPVFVEGTEEERQGGASNVSHNLLVWGIDVNRTGESIRSTKHRYMAGHHQVFRIDHDDLWSPPDDWRQRLHESLEQDTLDAVILSDYAKGTCRASVCEAAIRLCIDRKIPCIVDPKGESWRKYEGATVICPNQAEYAALRVTAPDCHILEKRGAEGIQLHPRDRRPGPRIPARGRHVFDVTGAGDTVVAAVAAGLAAGGTLEQAAVIGTIAAGFVVGEVGTATCPLVYLEEQCASSCVPEFSTSFTTATAAS